jgi:hypothetical protein
MTTDRADAMKACNNMYTSYKNSLATKGDPQGANKRLMGIINQGFK